MLYTSLNQIKSFNPCMGGWRNINKLQGIQEDELFPMTRCFETNTVSDVLWLLEKQNKKNICVEFAQWCANSVAHLKNSYADAAAYTYAATDAATYAATDATDVADAADVAATYAADAAYAAAYAADADAAYAANADAAYNRAREQQKEKLAQLIAVADELGEPL